MEKILWIKNLAKNYDGKIVHRDVNFHLRSNETLGLLGNSGTGKSVLLRSIIGLEEIDDGEIYYRGQRIDHLSEKELYAIRTKISYSFQSGALFDSISVFENVAYPLFEHTRLSESEIESRVMEILNVVNMKEAADLMPSDLSGGMQKRVGLARSMALQPDILLYDEPTAGLDPINVEMVLDVMKRFKNKGLSGIFVTHDIPAALKICDRLLILREGVIAFDGSIVEFQQSKDPFVQTFFVSEEK
jgi:phospholipid/cholesterol/gamma-HCH transport system ATP-binding protein